MGHIERTKGIGAVSVSGKRQESVESAFLSDSVDGKVLVIFQDGGFNRVIFRAAYTCGGIMCKPSST